MGDFLYKNSKGNPLRLQEILLLPQLQHHFCFVEYRSIAPWKLEKSFVQLKDVSDEKAESAKVCDILDLEGLENVYVPENLLDVVREHTSGLSPEEQMLIKKCAILGSTFSFYILESVCPEYTMNDLRNSVAKLVRKNMLVLGCHHLMIDDCGLHRKSLTEMDDEYCFHPMKFSSEFLQQCVVNFMQQAQRDRIHLFIVSLLKEITITCDSCKMHRGEQTLKQNDCFPCQMNIPRLNLLTCFCRNFQISVYTEIRSHLKQSNAPIERQVMFMLKAASTALEAEKELLVGDFLEEAEDFANVPEHNYSSAQLIKAIILRLQAQRHYFLGAVDEAMASITQALEYIGKRFPADYLKPRLRHQPPHENFSILEEECKCLAVGCKILLEESRFDEAFDIAKTCGILFDIFGGAEHDNQFPEFTDILTKDCLLMITAANMQSRKRETKCRQTILHNCSHKLSKEAIVSTRYLESILLALIDVTYTLFAENKLEMAETVGFRVVQICRITKGVKQLIMVTPILCLVYYYSKETVKSFQMLSGFLNYAGTSGDMISEAMFYSMCMQLLLSMDCPETRCDKMKMCTTFASSKCEQTFHAGNIAHRYWIAAMMSEWCFEQNLMDAFKSWHAMADNLKPAVTMTNFWSLSGELKMIKISILKIKRKLEEKEKASEEINSVKKKLKSIERLINRYACVAMVDVKQTKKMLKKISLM